jgi:hypothetical protein
MLAVKTWEGLDAIVGDVQHDQSRDVRRRETFDPRVLVAVPAAARVRSLAGDLVARRRERKSGSPRNEEGDDPGTPFGFDSTVAEVIAGVDLTGQRAIVVISVRPARRPRARGVRQAARRTWSRAGCSGSARAFA